MVSLKKKKKDKKKKTKKPKKGYGREREKGGGGKVPAACVGGWDPSLGAGAENYAFTISSGSTTSSARKCYTFTGDYPGVMPGTGSVRPSEDETYRYSFLE